MIKNLHICNIYCPKLFRKIFPVPTFSLLFVFLKMPYKRTQCTPTSLAISLPPFLSYTPTCHMKDFQAWTVHVNTHIFFFFILHYCFSITLLWNLNHQMLAQSSEKEFSDVPEILSVWIVTQSPPYREAPIMARCWLWRETFRFMPRPVTTRYENFFYSSLSGMHREFERGHDNHDIQHGSFSVHHGTTPCAF